MSFYNYHRLIIAFMLLPVVAYASTEDADKDEWIRIEYAKGQEHTLITHLTRPYPDGAIIEYCRKSEMQPVIIPSLKILTCVIINKFPNLYARCQKAEQREEGEIALPNEGKIVASTEGKVLVPADLFEYVQALQGKMVWMEDDLAASRLTRALMYAAQQGHIHMVREFAVLGADLNFSGRNASCNSVLGCARLKNTINSDEMVDVLKALGAKDFRSKRIRE